MEKEMETDEEMEEVTAEPFVWEEIDLDYEFDADMYYDFTRPETEMEIREAEDWFKFVGTYPPSPFVVKLNGEKVVRAERSSIELKDVQNNGEHPENSEINENNSGVNMKSTVKVNQPRYSTLMKPTASCLAKQNQPRGVHSNTILRRFQFSLGDSIDISSQRSSLNSNHGTKRQKLEAGYFSNVPRLKRQTSLLHKLPKKVVSDVKCTIPKEPNLETATRAQRYRDQLYLKEKSKTDTTASEHNKSNACNFKARPLNRKILEAPTLLPPKKSIPQMPEFQVFHLKTSERAVQHTYDVNNPYVSHSRSENKCTRRPSSHRDTEQEKCVKAEKCKARPLDKILPNNEECDVFVNCKDQTTDSREDRCLDQKRPLDELPTELLGKLTLASECRQCSTKFRCKMHFPDNCSKENVPGFLDREHEAIDTFAKFAGAFRKVKTKTFR